MSAGDDDSDKSFEPTPQKLQKARDKGEIARSADLHVAAVYGGFVLALLTAGPLLVSDAGAALSTLIGRSDELSSLFFPGPAQTVTGGLMAAIVAAMLPLFVLPACAVLLSILAQRAFVVTGQKIKPKLSRISLLSNAKNKFGRGGLFEFAKSFVKLLIYCVCLTLFLRAKLPEMLAVAANDARTVPVLMLEMMVQFLLIVLIIAATIGFVDLLWQRSEHLRKNRMTRKEVMDELKESDGDPHLKNTRRQRAQEIALNQMMSDVPQADVVIVNPTHYAVALQWSRMPGTAPSCIAKGVDEIAATIRQAAMASGVPIYSDPPTARSIHATVAIGQEIEMEHYQAVATAIRFAESMRRKAKGAVT